MECIDFYNYSDSICRGRVVTHFGDIAIVQARNPYGTHNLMGIVWDGNAYKAVIQGNLWVFGYCNTHAPKKQFRKVFSYLVRKGFLNEGREVVDAFYKSLGVKRPPEEVYINSPYDDDDED